MSSDSIKDNIIKLQALQIKNLLRKLESSVPYEEYIKHTEFDENAIQYKKLYKIIISSPSYKLGKKISNVLDLLRIKKFFLWFYYVFKVIKNA